MEKNWNFKEITNEIERIKNWKPKSEAEETEKYLALAEYERMLFDRTINDNELYSQPNIKESMTIAGKYVNRKKALDKKISKSTDEYLQERLIDFLKLMQNQTIENSKLDINSPIKDNYVNNLAVDDIVKLGDEFLNSIPFINRNAISEMIDKELLSLTNSDKVAYSKDLAIPYSTGHILSSYDENINLKILINILSAYVQNSDRNLGKGYFNKELNKNNIFTKFLPKIIELMSLDFIAEKNKSLAIDGNLFKNKLLNNYNMYSNNLTSILKMNKDYDNIINNVEKELIESKNTTKLSELKEKLKDPTLFVPPFLGNRKYSKYPSVHLANDILSSGRDVFGTLLAMKFYYLIKEDKEKGLWLLKVTHNLLTDNQTFILNNHNHNLGDYLTPDYVEQYNNDYKSEQEVIKKTLK